MKQGFNMQFALDDLSAFAVVAEELNFSRAAARIGISPSALSQTIRKLEARLGLRLLTRTTRSVALTPAGERLFAAVDEGLGLIRSELETVSSEGDAPTGHLRINASEYSALQVLEPALRDFLPAHPGITVEIVTDNGFVDIVAQRFDLGVRMGESVDKDMISFAVAPTQPIRIVASPAYLARHPAPDHPDDLMAHHCINMRFSGSGELFAWEFERDGKEFRIRVPSVLIVSESQIALNAALAGTGMAWMPQDLVREHLAAGRLVSVLDGWTAPLPELHVYYPDRNFQRTALKLLLDHLRKWAKAGGQS